MYHSRSTNRTKNIANYSRIYTGRQKLIINNKINKDIIHVDSYIPILEPQYDYEISKLTMKYNFNIKLWHFI